MTHQLEKEWVITRYPRTPDVCDTNMAQGWIPADEAFSSGHQFPPAHPQCACFTSYRQRTLLED